VKQKTFIKDKVSYAQKSCIILKADDFLIVFFPPIGLVRFGQLQGSQILEWVFPCELMSVVLSSTSPSPGSKNSTADFVPVTRNIPRKLEMSHGQRECDSNIIDQQY
jgi:hypothetical protein